MRIGIGLMALLSAFTGYWLLGVRETKVEGPTPERVLRIMLFGQLWLMHGLTAGLAAYAGFVLMTPRAIFIDLLPSALIGISVGYIWGRMRMRKAEIRRAGPDPSVPEDRLFPSDKLAMLLHEGFARPLPVWVDLSVMLLCTCLGGLVGLGLRALHV